MLLKTIICKIVTCIAISCYASDDLQSRSDENPLIRLHSYQRKGGEFLETTSLSISPLNDNNFEAFTDTFHKLSVSSGKQINTLCINSINGKANVKKFFEVISPVLKDILSIEFCSQEIDWDAVGKHLTHFPNILRIDFNYSGITDTGFEDLIGAYNYHLGKKRMVSPLRALILNRCENITPEGLTPSITCITTNVNKYPHLLGIGLQQRNRDWPKWAAVSFPLINQAIDIFHSQRMTCYHDKGTNNKIEGESILYRGAFIFTPTSDPQKRYKTSIEMDDVYSAWFDGIPLNYNTYK